MKSYKVFIYILGAIVSVSAASALPSVSGKEILLYKGGSIVLPEGANGLSKGTVDTLVPDLNSPYYIFSSAYRKAYKATKFTPQLPCTVKTIYVGAGGSKAGTKSCSVFVWADGSVPGSRLFSGIMTLKADSANYLYWNAFNLPTAIRVSGSFWAGNKELDTLFPTLGFDEAMSFPSQYSNNGTSWIAGDSILLDYMNAAVVKNEVAGVADISASPRPLILHIDSSSKSKISYHNYTPAPRLTDADETYWKDIMPGEIIIGYTNSVDVKEASLKELRLSGKGVSIMDEELGDNCILVKVSGGLEEEKAFLRGMKGDLRVRFIEPNWIYKVFVNPNDTYFNSYQWDKKSLKAPEAWNYGWGSTAIAIGIIDQGIEYTHPDLSARYATLKGYDYFSNDADPKPESGEQHGTHCSGNAAATINNSTGVAGMANARLYALRALSTGGGTTTAIGNSIQWCINNGVNVISMSFGGPSYSSFVDGKCQTAWGAGLILFAASGNDGADTVMYPAGYNNVLAVGSIGQSNTRSSFSDYGSHLKFVAPGENIWSTVPGGSYQGTGWSGTSMACPEAAGGAALVWAAKTTLTNAQVRDILINTATDLGTAGWDKYYGYGKFNLEAAVIAASGATATPADTGMITIYNSPSATGNLSVDSITHKATWIKSVSPTSFGVVPGESKGITVIVEAKLSTGKYYDTLWAYSNDPDNNPYPMPIWLLVGNVGIEEQGTVSSEQLTVKANPFIQSTVISYQIAMKSKVSLSVYDLSGRVVRTLADGERKVGEYKVDLNANGLSAGVYFVKLKVNDFKETQKIVLMK